MKKPDQLAPADRNEFNSMNTEYNSRVTLILAIVTSVIISISMLGGYMSYSRGEQSVSEFWLVLPYHIACIALSIVVFIAITILRKKHMSHLFISGVVSVAQMVLLMLLIHLSSHVEIPVIGIKNINVIIMVMFATGFILRFRLSVTLTLNFLTTAATIISLMFERTYISNYYPSLINIGAAFVVASFAAYMYWDSRVKNFVSTKKLEMLATSDALTSLHNRRSFDVYIEHVWQRAISTHTPMALFFIDIDHFKNYNDLNGHLEGDKCLAAVAKTISQSVRKSDFTARYGGEEFVVVLADVSAEKANAIADKLINAVRDLKIPHGNSVTPYVTISMGCMIHSPTPQSALSMTDYNQMADAALYVAKARGRNRYVLHPDAEK